jgi:hypothetical protein
MLEFIIQILTRWLSGVKQAYFYDKKWFEGVYVSVLMCIVYFAWAVINGNPYILLLISGLPIIYYFLYKAFKTDKTKQVHTLEYLGNYWFNFTAFFMGGDLLGLIFAIYVGDLVFNMPIQKYFTGNYINKVSITNDPTGRTTNFYLFGDEYKVRNLLANGYHKLYFAIFCTIAYCLLWYFNYSITIKDFYKLWIFQEKNVYLKYFITNVIFID